MAFQRVTNLSPGKAAIMQPAVRSQPKFPLMKLKTLSIVAASTLLGLTGAQAQSTGAAATGTSSEGTSETAARPGPTTSRLTQGRGPTASSTGRRSRKRHHSMRHGRRHHHRGGHGMMKQKSGTEKATPKPSSNGQ